VCKRHTGEVNINTGSCHFKVVHVRYEVQPLVGNEGTQQYPKRIQKSRAMTITPPLHIGDHIHSYFRFW
jgi:hypothetical protein